VELLVRERHDVVLAERVLERGNPARSVESGSLSTPFGAAVPSAVPAEPRPRSSSSCANSPPNEWPTMIGDQSSPRMIRS
jgi:hypothetical protein